MGCYVLGFQEIDQTQVAVVGGKGAHLGELSRIEGLRVPAGFCVTTDAFQRIMAEAPSIDDRLDRLSRLKPDDRATIWRRRLPARSPGSASKPPTPSDPVRRRRTYRRPPSRASRTRT
jgi:pyruvate,water dikinase